MNFIGLIHDVSSIRHGGLRLSMIREATISGSVRVRTTIRQGVGNGTFLYALSGKICACASSHGVRYVRSAPSA